MPPKRGSYIGPAGGYTTSRGAEDAQVSLVVADLGLDQLRKNMLV